MRDYGFEQIFGDKDCEHEWGDEIIKVSSGGKGYKQDTNKGSWFENKQNICLKCQAWKGQLGLEPTPEMYIEHLTEIFNEAKRVLKKEGTLWLNMGDTYGGSCQGGGDTGLSKERYRKELLTYTDKPQKKLMPKCLLMIPERLAWSLIQNGWILRNKIIWYKPNAMPSSVTDRFSNRWEYIFMFSKSQRYYFDLDAVREAHIWAESDKRSLLRRVKGKSGKITTGLYATDAVGYNPDGKNPGDVFEINTQPFPEAHFAVFPEKLCEKPVKAGCPEQVCKRCGKPRERIIEKEPDEISRPNLNGGSATQANVPRIPIVSRPAMVHKTIGWTFCNCNAGFEGGIVLDPFAGAGTALYVAKEMKRRFIGIDIKQEYCDMCEKRLAQGVL